MARYSNPKITSQIATCRNMALNNSQRGKAFEDLTCYLFNKIPGISITQRNQMNAFQNEEIDVAIWNEKSKKGLYFLPNITLIECKNWTSPVSSIEVAWFCHKLESRGLDFGILIAHKGITGRSSELTAANSIISQYLTKKIQLVVITTDEILILTTTEELVNLIKLKLCKMAVSGRID